MRFEKIFKVWRIDIFGTQDDVLFNVDVDYEQVDPTGEKEYESSVTFSGVDRAFMKKLGINPDTILDALEKPINCVFDLMSEAEISDPNAFNGENLVFRFRGASDRHVEHLGYQDLEVTLEADTSVSLMAVTERGEEIRRSHLVRDHFFSFDITKKEFEELKKLRPEQAYFRLTLSLA